MASAFIGSAINLNLTLQESLLCSIHRGLLQEPMILPCKAKHRLCKGCLETLIGTERRINCPMCREPCVIPQDWDIVWFDRVLNDVTQTLSSTETELNQKVIDFVKHSYSKFGPHLQSIIIKSVEPICNARLKAGFEKFKSQFPQTKVMTLLHGTKRKFALSLAGSGFKIPDSFKRNPENESEGELKFGKAIYFGYGKKATEYGNSILVLADCALGKVQQKDESELNLTPEIMKQRGFHSIYYLNPNESLVNQEWAIFYPQQCNPLCIIEYESLDSDNISEQQIVQQIKRMNHQNSNWNVLKIALSGTENQKRAALNFIGNAGRDDKPIGNEIMHRLLNTVPGAQLEAFLMAQNETIRILFLRALWQTGRNDPTLQDLISQRIHWPLLIECLKSGYADVSWRACGVMTNLTVRIPRIRSALVEPDVLSRLMVILKRAVSCEDKICILTVLNLLSNVAVTEYAIMKQHRDILNYVNTDLLDHRDEEIQLAGNRLFCNIISKGAPPVDWQRTGYKNINMAPKPS